MIPKRVLLVDDELEELDGFKALLEGDEGRWDVVQVGGGREALDAIACSSFDVVVSDLALQGFDGVELLQAVKRARPTAARIVLSDESSADRMGMVRALSAAHQVVAKPCDVALLKDVVERTCNLQELVASDAVRSVVGKVSALPAIPRTYWELSESLSRPNAGLGALAEIVSRDPLMSARVLQIVNSAYFGLERRISSIREAVTFLGVDALKGLALTAHVFSGGSASLARSLERLQRGSMAVARLAKGFVDDPDRSEETFSAAIVHDVGRIVLRMSMPEQMTALEKSPLRGRRPMHTLEREALGVTHAEVGAYLLGVWGLPMDLVEVVAYHHEPSRASPELARVVGAVHAADALVDAVLEGSSPEVELDKEFLGSVGMLDRMPRWRALAATELAWLRDLEE